MLSYDQKPNYGHSWPKTNVCWGKSEKYCVIYSWSKTNWRLKLLVFELMQLQKYDVITGKDR
jgi:hypothetical protein